jgi:glucarate dehydratase
MILAGICDTFGRNLSMHSNSHLGHITGSYGASGCCLALSYSALDTHYPWQSDEVMVGGRFKFEEGSVSVPKELD